MLEFNRRSKLYIYSLFVKLFDSFEIRIQTVEVRSDGWADSSHLDTADTWAITDIGDLEVSVVTPGGAPGVLDEVVGLSVLGSVSNGEDTVVELSSASGGVEDARSVSLEGTLVGLDGDGGWSGLDGGLEGRLGVGGDLDVSGGLELSGVGGLGAGSVSSGVGVVGLELSHVGLVPFEGTFHGATVATGGADVVTVDEFLLGEGEESSGLDEVSTLHGTSGGEGPA